MGLLGGEAGLVKHTKLPEKIINMGIFGQIKIFTCEIILSGQVVKPKRGRWVFLLQDRSIFEGLGKIILPPTNHLTPYRLKSR